MTDTESEKEEGVTAGSVPVMASNKRPATEAGPSNDQQAAEPDSEEDDVMAAQQTGRLGQQSSHSAQEASSSGVPDSNTMRATGTHQRGKRRLRTAGGRVITTDQPAAGAQQGRNAAARAKPAATAVPANAGARAAKQGNNAAARAKPAATAGHTSAGAQRARQGKNAAARQPIQRGRSSFSFDRTPEADDDDDDEAAESDPDAPTRRAK